MFNGDGITEVIDPMDSRCTVVSIVVSVTVSVSVSAI